MRAVPEIQPTDPPRDDLRLLLVDDDAADRLAMRRYLRQAAIACAVDEADSGDALRDMIRETTYDCIFLDYSMPGADAFALVAEIQRVTPGVPIVIFTGRGDEDIATALLKAGATDYLPKASLAAERLASSLRNALAMAKEAEARRRAEAERHVAEQAVRASEERFRRALEIETVGVVYFTTDGAITEANDAFLRMSGYSRADLDAGLIRWDRMTPAEYMEASARAINELIATGRTTPYEKEYLRKDGSRRWALFAATQLNETESVEFVVDITQQKETEQALRENERRERLLASVSQQLVASLADGGALQAVALVIVPELADFCFFDVLNPDGSWDRVGIRHADPAQHEWMNELAGMLRSATPDRHPAADVLHSREPVYVAECADDWIQQTSMGSEHLEFLERLSVRSLIRVPVVTGNDAVGVFTMGMVGERRFGDGDLDLAVGIGRSAAIAYHDAEMLRQAQVSARVRDEVTAIVSHDLRSPLGTIHTAVTFLLEVDMEEDARRRHLEIIQRGTRQMTRLVDDLIDVAKAEMGQLVVEARPETVGALLTEACDNFSLRAAELGIDLRIEMPDDLPPVMADAQRVVQVLSNLIANALKFTPPGGSITLSAEAASEWVSISVADTGMGIASEHLAHVFDRFWQLRRAPSSSAGLGLAIAKSLIEAHGGRMFVESSEGAGSVFGFELPAARRG